MNFAKVSILSLLLLGILIWAGCEGPPSSGGSVTIAGVPESAEPGEPAAESAAPAEWLTSYEEALAKAGEQNRTILINFTGSDWCPPCMALEREVFSTSQFEEYAAQHLVLLEIDFPYGKEQSNELVGQNHGLQQKYGIQGFPTIVLLNPKGEEVKRGGYRPGGARVFIGWLEG
jgi:thiol:disulfide interchange protein